MQMPVAPFAYFGPETVLPLTSIVAAVAGVVMMFGRNSVRLVVRGVRGLIPGRATKAPGSPHFAQKERDRTRSHSSETNTTA